MCGSAVAYRRSSSPSGYPVVVLDQVDHGRHLDHVGLASGCDHVEQIGHARLESATVGDDHIGAFDRLAVAQRDLVGVRIGARRDDRFDTVHRTPPGT